MAILGNMSEVTMKKIILIAGLFASGFSFAGIDTSIYQKQQEYQLRQNQQTWATANELAANAGGIVFNRRVAQMRQLKTIEEKRAFANKSIYRNYLNKILDEDIAQENYQAMLQAKHDAEIQNLKAQTERMNAEAQLLQLRASSPPELNTQYNSRSKEEKVYVEHIDDNLYKTDDGRVIKTQACYEYVYGDRALIIKSKLIFRSGRTCDIEKVIDL